MKELAKRYMCELCGYITTKDYLVCPACENGIGKTYKQNEDLICGCGGATLNCPNCGGSGIVGSIPKEDLIERMPKIKKNRPLLNCSGMLKEVKNGQGGKECRVCRGEGLVVELRAKDGCVPCPNCKNGNQYINDRKLICPTCHGTGIQKEGI